MNSTIAMLILASTASKISYETATYPQMVNDTLVIDIVSRLHRLHHFKNFVFYVSERLVKDSDISKDFFRHFAAAFPSAPHIVINDNTQSMDGFLSTPSLSLVLTTAHDDDIMEVTAVSMKAVRFLKTIFIVFPYVDKSINDVHEQRFKEEIRLIYAWIWKEQFINTILITIRNNIYLLEPYPTGSIINKTEKWKVTDFFHEYDKDFKGYVINTPVHHDLPRIFHLSHRPQASRKDFVSGVSGKLFTAFVKAINATLNQSQTTQMEKSSLNINGLLAMVENKKLELGMNSFTDLFATHIGTSYPIGINDWCLMVPFRNRSPEHMYLQKSFHGKTWLLICFSVLYVTVGIWLASARTRRDLSLSFLQALCSILLITPLRILRAPIGRIRFLFVLLFVLGFSTTNLYISKLASFLMTSTNPPQLNTLEDVINANLPIMLMDYEYDILKSYNYPQSFLDLVIKANKHEMDKHRDSFNTSYGYSIQSDRWNFLNIQQQNLKKPLFRLTNICIGPFYHVFPMERDSHFANPLKVFIMSSSQFGLMEHWEREAFADALFLGYVRMMLINDEPQPLSLNFFRYIWYVWACGLLLSFVVFCFEVKAMIWQNIRNVCLKLRRSFKNK